MTETLQSTCLQLELSKMRDGTLGPVHLDGTFKVFTQTIRQEMMLFAVLDLLKPQKVVKEVSLQLVMKMEE